MKAGDIKHYKEHTVKVLSVFNYDGEEYAEIEPIGYGFPVEVKTSLLSD